LKAAPGEMVGLIGPNGSGKSTIIKALCRVMQPQSGNVTVNGRDIHTIPRHELACQVGVVPQMPLLPSTFTAFEIVLMGRNPHLKLLQSESAADLEMAWHAMEKTGTEELANRYINELSGGEIQSVLIARVLVQETGAILLDEPTANLDIGRQVDIFDMIHKLCEENNLAVLAAIHDLNLAAQYCHRVILINKGHIHAEGTPQEVITEQNIREVYGAENCVYTHPANGLPTVLLGAHRNRANGK
ncbi:MAG TPA: ABC transporter ATP-binding protein, partial [Dehalococcoidales bacterium]|nr:ABC transporter ATP-binding protein [Dehalococcoidales bacterium]